MLVCVAAAVGAVNWALTDVVKINPLIATLVTYTALQGVAYLLRPLPDGKIDPVFLSYVDTKFGFVPIMVIVAIVVALALELPCAAPCSGFGCAPPDPRTRPRTGSVCGPAGSRWPPTWAARCSSCRRRCC